MLSPEERRAEDRAYMRAYRIANPAYVARQRLAHRVWYDRNRASKIASVVAGRRLAKYGLTPEMFDEYLAAQEGMCGFCDQPLPSDKRRIAVDHDHVTGHYRALLHISCNALLGRLERPDWDVVDLFVSFMAAHPRDVRRIPAA